MQIEIKNIFDGTVIVSGEYKSIKDCLENNITAYLSGANLSSANLSGANLSGANLHYADLSGANLSDANLYGADLSGAYLSGANLSGANLSRANLSDANLYGADLSGANLHYADLSGAYLSKIKGYVNSHDIFIQIVRNNLNKFTQRQQEIASRIYALRLCWDSIKKEYKRDIGKIFNIMAKLGFDEYKKEWERIKKGV